MEVGRCTRGVGGAQRLTEQKPSSGSLACVATINAIAARCIHTPLRFMQNSRAATPARGFIDEFARAFPPRAQTLPRSVFTSSFIPYLSVYAVYTRVLPEYILVSLLFLFLSSLRFISRQLAKVISRPRMFMHLVRAELLRNMQKYAELKYSGGEFNLRSDFASLILIRRVWICMNVCSLVISCSTR